MASYASALRVAEAEAQGVAEVALPAAGASSIAVVDANAVIRGMNVQRLADAIVTVPAVLAEVRDSASRAALASFHDLATREPSDESMAAVRRFARATGDSAVLSLVDTQLLALAHTLHVAAHGSAQLRDTPAPLRAAPRRRGRNAAAPMPGWDYVDNAAEWEALEREEAEAAAERAGDAPAAAEPPAADQHASRVADGVMQLSLDDVKVRAVRAACAPRRSARSADPRRPAASRRRLRRLRQGRRATLARRTTRQTVRTAGRTSCRARRACAKQSASSAPPRRLPLLRRRLPRALPRAATARRATASQAATSPAARRRRTRRTTQTRSSPRWRSSPPTLPCRRVLVR